MSSILKFTSYPKDYKPKTSWAIFDLDHTIVKPKGKKKFSKDENDWEFMVYLKGIDFEKFTLIIITNQKINKRNPNPEKRLAKIIDELKNRNVGAYLFALTSDNHYRKPFPFIIDYISNDLGVKMNKNKSFYCGDAAGREDDFSASDRQFAHNVGIKFYTPEMYFELKDEQPYEIASFYPEKYKPKLPKLNTEPKKQTLIICVGPPGSGKTYTYETYYAKTFTRISQDELKTRSKCLKTARSALENGENVYVDNTNRDEKTRKYWVDLAAEFSVKTVVLYFDIDKPAAKHFNKFRVAYCHETDQECVNIPDVAINTYFAKHTSPEKSEGFDTIKKIKVLPDFKNKKIKNLFMNYYI